MTQKTARLLLCLLVGHVLLVLAHTTTSYNECEPQEFAKCNQVFEKVFKDPDKNGDVLDTYCDAYKEKLQCLASNATKCVGKIIDLIRWAVFQHVTKDVILGTCADIDVSPLRKVVLANEKYRMKVPGLKDVATDKFQPCAARKNMYCASRYAESMKKDDKVCLALPDYFACYESKTRACHDKIFKDFITNLKKTTFLVKDFAKKFPHVMPGCSMSR